MHGTVRHIIAPILLILLLLKVTGAERLLIPRNEPVMEAWNDVENTEENKIPRLLETGNEDACHFHSFGIDVNTVPAGTSSRTNHLNTLLPDIYQEVATPPPDHIHV